MCAPITNTVYKLTFSPWARFAIAKKDFLPSSSTHAGTTRLACFSTTAMPKRTRNTVDVSKKSDADGREGPVSDNDCPICFEGYAARGARTMTRPFQCAHSICRSCDHRMSGQQDNRCPTCRAPRQGFTAAQAEPPPDRFGPSMEEILEESLPPELQGMFTDGAFASRLLAQAREMSRSRGATSTITFHVATPTEWGDMPHEIAQQVSGEALEDRSQEAGSPNINVLRLFAGAGNRELTGLMPRELLNALVDVPSVSLSEWRRRAAVHGQGAERGGANVAPQRSSRQPPLAPTRRDRFYRSFGLANRAPR